MHRRMALLQQKSKADPTAEALNHVVQPPGNAQGERAARVQAREHSP